MKITKKHIKAAEDIVLDERSVVEARSYGGAYDIEDDMFFTRDDIIELADNVIDILNDTAFPEYHRFEYVDAYMTSPKDVTIEVTDGDNNFSGSATIDMRRIYRPQDILKYAREIVSQMTNDIQAVYSSTSVFSADDTSDDDLEELEQEHSSAKTSINSNKVPAVFKLVTDWKSGTINLDFGGGSFDTASEYLADKGVTNLIYDKFNRSTEHNREVIKQIRANGGADTATCSNVLNVIKEPEVRTNVLENIKKLVKPTGTVYITVYEGSGKGNEGETKSGYQLNRKTAGYLDEIKEVFPDATRKGKLIIAHPNGKSAVKSATTVPVNDLRTLSKAAANVTTYDELEDVISSLLSVNKEMYNHYSEAARAREYSAAALGKMISDELYYLGEDKIESSTAITASISLSALNQEIANEVVSWMMSEGGFPENEAEDYSFVETEQTEDGRIHIEVRAEISYDSMLKLSEVLDSIVSRYDKYAYFEQVTSGIMECYIETQQPILAFETSQYMDPYDKYESKYMEPITESQTFTIDDLMWVNPDISHPGSADRDWQGGDSNNRGWAQDIYSDKFGVKVADSSEVSEFGLYSLDNYVPDEAGLYKVHADVTVTFTVDGVYEVTDPYDSEYNEVHEEYAKILDIDWVASNVTFEKVDDI